MLNQQTLAKLHALRLHGMAEAFRAQPEQAGITELSFEERLALLVDQQWNWRQNRALERRLAKAKLRHRASVEDIDFRSPRGLDRTLLRSLTQSLSQNENVLTEIGLFDERVWPHGFHQVILRNHLAPVLDQDNKNVQSLWVKRDRLPAAQKQAPRKVESVWAE